MIRSSLSLSIAIMVILVAGAGLISSASTAADGDEITILLDGTTGDKAEISITNAEGLGSLSGPSVSDGSGIGTLDWDKWDSRKFDYAGGDNWTFHITNKIDRFPDSSPAEIIIKINGERKGRLAQGESSTFSSDGSSGSTDDSDDSDDEDTVLETNNGSYGPDNCGALHYLASPLKSGSLYGYLTDEKPIVCNGDKWMSTQAYADALDWYQHGLSVHAQDIEFRDQIDNWIEVSEQLAFSAGERAIANASADGRSKSFAKSTAISAVKDYYSFKQANLINHWNMQVSALKGLNSTDTYSGTGFAAQAFKVDQSSTIDWANKQLTVSSFGNETRTLENGTNITAKTFDVRAQGYLNPDGYDGSHSQNLDHAQTITIDSGDTVHKESWTDSSITHWIKIEFREIEINAPSGYDDKSFVYFDGYANDYEQIVNQSQGVVDDMGNFTDGVWADLEGGKIEPSEVISRSNKIYNYLLNSENATLNEGIAGLLASGYSSPSVTGNSSYMNLSYRPDGLSTNITEDGFLFSTNSPPNGSWQVGTTYNSSNISGTQFVVGLDGTENTINGSFVINEVYDRDGSVVESPDLSSPQIEWKTTNTTGLQNLIEDLGEYSQYLSNLTTDNTGAGAGGGGGGDSGSGGTGGIGDTINSFLGSISSVLGVGDEIVIIGILLIGVVALLR